MRSVGQCRGGSGGITGVLLRLHSSRGKAIGEKGPATELELGSNVAFQPRKLRERVALLLPLPLCAGHECASNCDRLMKVFYWVIVHTRKVTVMNC